MAISSGTTFAFDGFSAYAENASEPWSLTQLDADTLRFSVQSGDHWTWAGGQEQGAERSEVEINRSAPYSAGTQINVSYQLTVQPGPTNTAQWVDLGQLHSDGSMNPPSPVYLSLDTSDHLEVILQSPNNPWILAYRSPDPIVRGQAMDLNFQMNMDPSGPNGYVGVWLNGAQIVNYHGAVGTPGAQYYWKEGVYRGPAAETLTADFSNLHITTGAASAPSAPSQPTTSPTTPPTTPPAPATPSVTKPVLTVANDSLWVSGRGGTVDLGTQVTTTDSNDRVALHITGLPRYESITDTLDGQTFRGSDITLEAAQVNSGLTLTSTYRGGGHPVAALTLTASATDPSTGALASSSPQTITVTDPRPARDATTDHPQVAAANTGWLANRGFALLQQHFDAASSSLATSAANPVMAADHPSDTGSMMASLAGQNFALLNQYLAAHTGRVDPGQIVAAVSQSTGWGPDALLAKPQH